MTLNRQGISTYRGLPRRVSGEGANVISALARWRMGVEALEALEALEEDLDMSLRFSAGVQEQERTRPYTLELKSHQSQSVSKPLRASFARWAPSD